MTYEEYLDLVDSLNITGFAKALITHCLFVGFTENTLTLSLPKIFCALYNPKHEITIASELANHFKKIINVKIIRE